MLGFPHETKEAMLATAAEMNRVGIDSIKLHNLLVIRKTRLARMYLEQPFPLFEYDEYIELVCDFLERLSPGIVVERLCAVTYHENLIAPNWGCKSTSEFKEDVKAELKRRGTWQGCRLA